MTERAFALNALIDILENGAYTNLRLKQGGEAETPFVHALISETLDHLLYIDYILSHYVKRQKRVVRNILRMSAAEMLYMHTPVYAVVDEAVRLCKQSGKSANAPMVNAVLRRLNLARNSLPPLPTEPIQRMSIQYSCSEWIIRQWVETYGIADTEAILSAPRHGIEIRAQHPFTTRQLLDALDDESYSCGPLLKDCVRLKKPGNIAQSERFLSGQIAIQNQGSMAICQAMGDLGGKKVLDACAAPGGKSAYLYSLFHGDIDLTCCELHPHRKDLMNATFARLHVSARTMTCDATILQPAFENQFDAVLLDAPCSGLGLLHDKPDIGYNRTEADVASLVTLQEQLMETCCRYVKSGGLLLYATCTICVKENERQTQRFLQKHTEFSLDDARQYLPHVDGIDGFYYARMKKCT